MQKNQTKEIENFIITHIGLNNPYTNKLKNLAIKVKESADIVNDLPQELKQFALSLLCIIFSVQNENNY